MANYFCHQCNARIPNVNDDFTCPTCRSGFVETVEDAPGPVDSDDEQMFGHLGGGMDFLQLLLGGLSGNPPSRRTARGGDSSSRTSTSSSGAASGAETSQNASQQGATGTSQPTSDPSPHTPGTHRRRQPQFQVFLDGGGGSQISMGGGMESFDNFLGLINDMLLGLDPRGAAGQFRVGPGGNFSLGDYVIGGRESLDAIITQLMNQAEGQGPPPLKEDKISALQETPVTQSQLDSKLQCSVCWEDFIATDKVIQLQCEHIYHPNCILPWLKLHGTCPVCRKDLNDPPTEPMQESTSSTTQPQASAPAAAAASSSSGSASESRSGGPGGIHDELMEFD